MGKKSSFEIILGSYEEFLIGFSYNKKNSELTQSFASHSHSGSIRSVTQTEGLLASGGSDDRIVVYDLKTRKEHCMLTHHNGTVNCLQFTKDRTHLISGSQDGTLSIVRVGNWQLEKIWENAHKGGAIVDIALHSSGKLALTLGSDGTLRTWNLIKGRQAYAINLNSKFKNARSLHSIRWAPDGVRFALIGNTDTDIWSIDSGGSLKLIEHNTKVTDCIWESDEKLIVAYESGEIGVVNVETGDVQTQKAHDVRVKCISVYKKYIISASSAGEIKIWDMELNQLSSTNAGCRFTCMCVVPPVVLKKEKDVDISDVEVAEENDVNVVIEDEDTGNSSSDEVLVVQRKKVKGAKVVVTEDKNQPKLREGDKKRKIKGVKDKKTKKKRITSGLLTT